MDHDDHELELLGIAHAKRQIERDPGLCVYMVQDYELVKAAGLFDLAWALSHDGSCHRNDVIGFFELLEKYIGEAANA